MEALKFKEYQFEKGEYGRFAYSRLVFLEDTQMFAKILSLPISLLSSKDFVYFMRKKA